MSGQPRLVIEELANERIAMFDEIVHAHHVDELRVRRLQAKIERLLDADLEPVIRAIFHHELAYLYAYRRKSAESAAHFDEAERLGLTNVKLALSRAHAHYMCGNIEESSRHALMHSPNAGSDDERGNLLVLCIEVGMFVMANNILQGMSHIDQPYVSSASAIIEQIGCSESDVTARLQVAADVLMGAISHPLMSYNLLAIEGEGMLYRFVVKADVDELVVLDRAIDRALSERFDAEGSELDRFLSIGVKPYTEDMDFSLGEPTSVYL